MKLTVVSYTINGRGMGHLVRQLAILRWVRRICALLDVQLEAWVLTSSEADTLARREGVPALKMPSKAMLRDAGMDPARFLPIARTWVLQTIASLRPDVLVVDTFPGGSFGELVAALELARTRVLVARRVRDEVSEAAAWQALLPLYDAIVRPDDGGVGPILSRERAELMPRDAARAALGIPEGRRGVWVSLGGGGDPAAATTLPRLVDALRARDWHVVVGAGPLYQGPERRGDGITWLSRYTPVELFQGLDAAVSAGGYNAFHELMFAGVPTVFLPLPRIADDQLERVERAVAVGAGRRAPTIEAVADLLEDPGSPDAARALVPHNGARDAALAVLAPVLDAADLAMAREAFDDALLGLLARSEDPARALGLARLLAGGTPARARAQRAVLAELDVDREVPEPRPADRVARFVALCDRLELSPDQGHKLLEGLSRKFPAADGEALLRGAEALFPIWARFGDWMGAVSLLRSVPTQRGYALAEFARDLGAWLEHEEDLFDALRAFARLEAGGRRPVAEVLRLLRASAAGPGSGR